jgi:hypothetical protein
LAALAGPAAAHPVHSPDATDRRIVVTPMADGVRIAYEVVLGDGPGRRARGRIDRDRDGALADDERAGFAAEVGREVAARASWRLDGIEHPVRWREARVEIEPAAGGGLAIALVGWACPVPGAPPRHELALRDRFAPPEPGHGELRVEAPPGVRVLAAGLGDGAARTPSVAWTGAANPLATSGFRLAFDPGPDAPRGGGCAATATAGGRRRGLAIAGLVLLILAGAVLVARRARPSA